MSLQGRCSPAHAYLGAEEGATKAWSPQISLWLHQEQPKSTGNENPDRHTTEQGSGGVFVTVRGHSGHPDPGQRGPLRPQHAGGEAKKKERQESELLTEAKFNGKSSSLLYYTLVSQTKKKKNLQVKKVVMVTQHFIHIS